MERGRVQSLNRTGERIDFNDFADFAGSWGQSEIARRGNLATWEEPAVWRKVLLRLPASVELEQGVGSALAIATQRLLTTTAKVLRTITLQRSLGDRPGRGRWTTKRFSRTDNRASPTDTPWTIVPCRQRNI